MPCGIFVRHGFQVQAIYWFPFLFFTLAFWYIKALKNFFVVFQKNVLDSEGFHQAAFIHKLKFAHRKSA